VPEIVVKEVSLGFGSGASRVSALQDISLTLQFGCLNLMTGPSGSGKTTLLSLLGGLVASDKGTITVSGSEISRIGVAQRNAFRRTHVGYVFQSFRLINALTAEQNILLSLEIRRADNARAKCQAALEKVGLAAKSGFLPKALSGGEQQRVAIARAIAHGPTIVLADEPTANLDSANGLRILQLLTTLARDPQRVIVIVSHDSRTFPFAERVIRLADGRVVGTEPCADSR
jgi:putative ABC transport system ATP-binding protein